MSIRCLGVRFHVALMDDLSAERVLYDRVRFSKPSLDVASIQLPMFCKIAGLSGRSSLAPGVQSFVKKRSVAFHSYFRLQYVRQDFVFDIDKA